MTKITTSAGALKIGDRIGKDGRLTVIRTRRMEYAPRVLVTTRCANGTECGHSYGANEPITVYAS